MLNIDGSAGWVGLELGEVSTLWLCQICESIVANTYWCRKVFIKIMKMKQHNIYHSGDTGSK